MDDIIVIILTLALTIVAAINQSKKKKQQLPQPESGEPDFWEEILHGGKPKPASTGEYHDNAEPDRIPAPAKVRKPAENPMKMKKPARNSIIQDPFKEGGRNEDILRHSEIRDTSLRDLESDEKGESILEEFSLKKAVIYSEIIHPKYF